VVPPDGASIADAGSADGQDGAGPGPDLPGSGDADAKAPDLTGGDSPTPEDLGFEEVAPDLASADAPSPTDLAAGEVDDAAVTDLPPRVDAAGELPPVADVAAELPPPDAGPAPGVWKAFTTAGKPLRAVSCVAGHVFAVGEGGLILHLGPGQGAFEVQKSPTDADLNTVAFADASYGVAAGKGSSIWQTKDLGQTWGAAPQCGAVVYEVFHALHLHAAAAGFGVGQAAADQAAGLKYYGGGSWVCNPKTWAGLKLYDVVRRDTVGWAVGDTAGQVLRSEDAGITWTPGPVGTTKPLRGLAVLPVGSGVLGLAVGEAGTVVRSLDGKAWAAVSSPTKADLFDVFLLDGSSAWAVGAEGRVLRSLDGGQSWQVQASPTAAALRGVCLHSATSGWAVGDGGVVLRLGE
jgi:photosystem II stability/assembly factor-like uncharacterized protein